MLNSIFAKTLRDSRGGIIWWGIGAGSLGFLVGALWPTIQENIDMMMGYLEAFPDWMLNMLGGGDLATLAGWANLEFLAFLPIIFSIATIAACSGAFQGEEDKRTMDLLMSQPIPRWRVGVEKMAAITVALFAATFITSALFILGLLLVDVEFDFGFAFLAPFNAIPLALAMGALALFGSAFFPTRGVTTAVSATVLTASYFLQTLGEMVEGLRNVRGLSLYYYYASSQPMAGIMDWGHVFVLFALAAVLFAASLWAFERRELRL